MRSVCIFQKWFSGRHKPGDYRILIITLVHSRHIIVQKISKIQLTPPNSFWENQRFVIFKKCDFFVFHKITFYCSVLWQNAIHHLKEHIFLNNFHHICISPNHLYKVKNCSNMTCRTTGSAQLQQLIVGDWVDRLGCLRQRILGIHPPSCHKNMGKIHDHRPATVATHFRYWLILGKNVS